MTSTIQDLKTALTEWRETTPSKKAEPNEHETRYGKELHELNTTWGQRKAEVQAQLNEERAAYIKRREELHALLKREAGMKTEKAKSVGGRPTRPEYSDAVKIAAYLVSQDFSKSMVRITMSLQDTKLLNRTLEEGKALYDLQQAQAANTPGEEW